MELSFKEILKAIIIIIIVIIFIIIIMNVLKEILWADSY